MVSDKLCCDVFGGSPWRWYGSYKWFLYYIHDRYYNTVFGMNGLLRVLHCFPIYAMKICRKFNHERYYLENCTLRRIDIESTVLDENEFCIHFFLMVWDGKHVLLGLDQMGITHT